MMCLLRRLRWTWRARFLRVAESGQALLVSRHGRPMVRLVPVERELAGYGSMSGSVRVIGGSLAETHAVEESEATRENLRTGKNGRGCAAGTFETGLQSDEAGRRSGRFRSRRG